MKNWRDNVYFTLVEPREPGNIGACARAIKNMDFKNLCLVEPPALMTDEAQWFARNAGDVLDSAAAFDSIRDAVSDKHFVVGTSRRRGRRRGVFIPVEEGARRIFEIAHTGKIAVLFGREDRGLYNEEIEGCAFLMTIPAGKEQPSINLAQAVMIIAYEISKAGMAKDKSGDERLLTALPPKTAGQHELSLLYERMENALKLLEYIPPDNKFLRRKIMQNLKHCLGRAGLTDWEFNMFHGICKQIEKKLGGEGK
ncbi:MAG TPA: RNA methyltransferase [Nitrospirae bacterium]|nr:putative tRNA/rRNA methyltransferase [bacterium BMS3Abin06]HDH12287.1 RNA methyltransferase [Nitrospirota bacterium]HDZ00794.1 RNA methyltransferase [Nitrospirota bacterium]